ncbi:MAG: OmlA [Hyphomicrobiales bacterium]|jgi:outer membrane protein assembly factor BamE (lipoprotein component of BamABCDE complex)|nr:OmlA [Hyphomicrobiales bacterium]
MPLSAVSRRVAPAVIVIALGLGLAGCSSFTTLKTQGYDLSQDALAQIKPGQSQQLVITVLGTPQTTNDLGQETAYYYVESKVEQTAFGMTNVKERTVLAIYFDKNKRVKDKAVYGLKDGRPVTIETRRTPSYGEDRTFIESIMKSF